GHTARTITRDGAQRPGSMEAGGRGGGGTPHPEVSSRRRGATPPPPARLSRFLVRYVPGDHLVHGLARMPDPFFAHREIDDGDTASFGHALHFFARHVAHEPGGHAVEPRRRLLGP